MEDPVIVNVGHSSHQWAQDDLGMILEEIYLHCAIGEVERDCRARAQPSPQARQSDQVVTFPRTDILPRSEQVLLHVAAEVLEEGYFFLQ